jgi:hypothetical protein
MKNIANIILKPLPAIQLRHLKSNETVHYTDHTPQINIVIKGACGNMFPLEN